jgi:50S ribosomal subunit-associated GTPase HflX
MDASRHSGELRMQRVRRLSQEQGQVNRHGDAEQRQEQGHNHTLLGEGAVHELTAVQFANQAQITLCGNEIHGYADRDKRRSKPE